MVAGSNGWRVVAPSCLLRSHQGVEGNQEIYMHVERNELGLAIVIQDWRTHVLHI